MLWESGWLYMVWRTTSPGSHRPASLDYTCHERYYCYPNCRRAALNTLSGHVSFPCIFLLLSCTTASRSTEARPTARSTAGGSTARPTVGKHEIHGEIHGGQVRGQTHGDEILLYEALPPQCRSCWACWRVNCVDCRRGSRCFVSGLR